MLTIELLQLIISGISQSFIFSQIFAYNREIVDGGTKNRIWSFMSIMMLMNYAFLPLMKLLPTTDLSFYTYPIMALSALIQYVASIAHTNQMAVNQNEPQKIKKLPFNLHENQFIMKMALFLGRHMAKGFLALYMVTLVGCAFFGAPVYAFTSLALYAVNLLNQHGYLPQFLRTPYLYLNIVAILLSIFGVTSWIGAGLSIAMVGFTVVDYVRCYFYGASSPTAQFSMADTTKKISLESIDAHDPEAAERLDFIIQKHMRCKKYLGIHVTFDHFYQSHRIMDKILAGSPNVVYEDYLTHFKRLNFRSIPLKNAIANEMCMHDKFNEKPLAERCTESGLPSNTDLIDIQTAYLHKEMGFFVDRLQHPSYRDLTHQQVTEIHRYSRFILNKINQLPVQSNTDTVSPRDTLILSIALRTGSHCNRVYLDTLSELAAEYGFLSQETLTRQEQTVMMAQSAREAAFRTYYYSMARKLKARNSYFSVAWDDVNDYHTYEDFVGYFGSNFYLRNPTLMMRFRTIFDLIADRVLFYTFKLFSPDFLFSNTYNASYLIEQIINPEGKLHKNFIEWCEEKYPSCYKNIVYDENYMINTGDELKALAELMLLDYGILGLSKAYPAETYAVKTCDSNRTLNSQRSQSSPATRRRSATYPSTTSINASFFTTKKHEGNESQLIPNTNFIRSKSSTSLG